MPANFDPSPRDSIDLFGRKHVVQPHPQVAYLPYSQLAGRAVVHQLRDQTGEYFALKVFKKQYRDPSLVGAIQNLKHVENFEGLRAARRRIVLPSDPAARKHRNLEYAMLMPWVHGKTWYDVLGQARDEGYYLPEPVAIRLCNRFLSIMEGLETAGVAHTDISPGNVMVEFTENDVQLLDLEDMYMPGADPPSHQSTGSTGYRHRSGEDGNTFWRSEGDRYSAAVLAAEMLILVSPQLARKATQEGFFRGHCGTSEGMTRFEEAQVWLEKIAPEFAPVFERSWFASSLEECPRISELRMPITELANGKTHVNIPCSGYVGHMGATRLGKAIPFQLDSTKTSTAVASTVERSQKGSELVPGTGRQEGR
jgi:serine/threonine protein kinase